ncbi:sulfotransferase family protein [Wenxinia saemankumensis]|uniref:Sulfotransferase family protein n=1 Tax=Wenxinia saemankumensis TaxID=1447782 RepID=A0A1M6ATX5_9RHOB|nr:sulfotransferase [Wenxinia saemankumensis]SHI39912.1 Sulfotransferase family protein [Wenxinia saemankumensis]
MTPSSSRADRPEPRPRWVFVGGLHRSGTSLLTRLISAHPAVSGIEGAPVPENEGVFLQGAIPHTALSGIPGAFARDADQHLVEGSRHDTLETALRLERDWAPWFAPGAAWRIEKSPVNLLRTRLYQQLFPGAHFILITRHPGPSVAAVAKWSDEGPARLAEHWDIAHRLVLGDLPYLHACLILRYEDLVADTAGQLTAALAFLGLSTDGIAPPEAVRDGNADYPAEGDAPVSEVAARFGYGPRSGPQVGLPKDLRCRHPLREVREAVAAVDVLRR